MSDKSQEHKIEDLGTPRKQTFLQKQIALAKRFWWVHLILFLCGVLIVTLCLVYVAFPQIAQDDVNDAGLYIDSQVVTNPTPDSVDLHIDAVSDSHSIYHPQLDSFNVSLALATSDSYDDIQESFGQITIPPSIGGPNFPINLTQTLHITNMKAFTNYTVAVLKQEWIYMNVKGEVPVHEMVLPVTTPSYNKMVHMKGLNGLKGLKVGDDLKIQTVGKNMGALSGTITIPNPSVLTLHMGTVSLDMYLKDHKIGQTIRKDLVLTPGDNAVSMSGSSNVNYVTSQISKYPSLKLPITIKGGKAVYQGTEIDYYSAALDSNPLELTIDVGKAIGIKS